MTSVTTTTRTAVERCRPGLVEGVAARPRRGDAARGLLRRARRGGTAVGFAVVELWEPSRLGVWDGDVNRWFEDGRSSDLGQL